MESISIKQQIEQLENSHRETLYQLNKKHNQKIEALRLKCKHNWYYAGRYRGDDWYKCTICGAMEEE